MSAGVPKSANARMNTSRAAARIVGIESASTTRINRLTPLQPKLSLTSIRLLSMFLNAPFM